MRGSILAAALLFWSGGALAQVQVPPPQYDRPYAGRLTVVSMPTDQMQRICPRGKICWAASYSRPGHCIIFLPNNLSADLVAQYRRHEIGHCNGWRH